MKKNLFYSISIIILALSGNINILLYSSNCDYLNAIYYLKPEDKAYLRYFIFENHFDTAYVKCQIGEFRVVNQGVENRVNIAQTLENCVEIEGDTATGEDQTLLQYSRTEQFIMPENGQVKFFRRLMAKFPCGSQPGNGRPIGGGTGDWRDDHWFVGTGRILDKTEFVIQLVRATDTTVIATIDSVGVSPNPNSQLAHRYGTDPDVMNHLRNLPNGYGGIPCYFRVSTRRFGPTPYGISFRINSSWVSQSHFNEYDSATIFRCDSSYYYLIEDRFTNFVINYLDSVKTVTGKLPNYSGLPLSDYLDSLIKARYYEMHIHNGDTIWVEIMDSSYYQKKGELLNKDKINELSEKQIYICQISPQPITSGFTKILIKSGSKTENAIIELYSVDGEKLKTLWKNTLFKGDNFATINLTEFNPGIYIIRLNNDSGVTFDSQRIVITK